jgi:hypothetical protein
MVEIIPKAPEKLPLWQSLLLFLSIILLMLAVGGYFGFGYFEKEISKEIKDVEKQISQVKTDEEKALEKNLFSLEKKVSDYSEVFSEHRLPSELFPFLAKICHPKVRFLSVDFSRQPGDLYKISIPSVGESYVVVHQQIEILRGRKDILDLEISNIAVGKEGQLNFNLSFEISPEIFSFKENKL